MIDIYVSDIKKLTKDDVWEFYKVFCQAYAIKPSSYDKHAFFNGTFTELMEDRSIRHNPLISEKEHDVRKYIVISLWNGKVRLEGFDTNPKNNTEQKKLLTELVREKYYPKE
ncbi:MAG: hypothetical protein WC916_00270 [Candidatus Woesearchaeota archaeon]